jgi:hypothetical protein
MRALVCRCICVYVCTCMYLLESGRARSRSSILALTRSHRSARAVTLIQACGHKGLYLDEVCGAHHGDASCCCPR